MPKTIRAKYYQLLKWSERFLKTDVRYLTRSGFWLSINQVVGALLSLILSILFARYLSQETFGIYKYVITMAGFFAAFSLTGMNSVIVRAVSQGYDGTLKASLLIQLKWSVGVVLTSLAVSMYYLLHSNNAYAVAFLVVAVFQPLGAVLYSYSSYLKGRQQFRLYALRSIITNSVYFLALVLTIFYLPQPIYLVAAYFVSNTCMHAFFFVRTLLQNPPHTPGIRADDISYAKHLSVMSVIAKASAYVEGLFVYHLLGPVQLAIYSFAIIVPDRIRSMFGIVTTAALPKLSANAHGTRESFMRKVVQLSIFAGVLVVGYVLVAPALFKWLFPQYLESLTYSRLYALTLLVLPVHLASPTLVAQNSKRALYIVNSILPTVKIILAFMLIYVWGILGAIVGNVIYYIVLMLLTTYYARASKHDLETPSISNS